jgi:MFS family permease
MLTQPGKVIRMSNDDTELPLELQPEYLNKTMKQQWRWTMLMYCCFFVMGNYFCYDYPACLEDAIETEFDVTPTVYGYLYSVYAIPNLILPLFGGILFDKYGSRICLVGFTCILMIGQGVFMVGGYKQKYWLMLLGRAIFGIGCESMYVGQSAIISEWFINYEMPIAMAMCSCIPLCGSFIGGSVIPKMYNYNSD